MINSSTEKQAGLNQVQHSHNYLPLIIFTGEVKVRGEGPGVLKEMCAVILRNIQTCEECLLVYLSQTVDKCQAESQRIDIMLRRMAILHLVLYITIKRGDVGYIKSIGDSLGRQEKAK